MTAAKKTQKNGGGLRLTVGALWWCLTSGVLTFLAFPLRPVPESSLWILAWVCLAPLLYAIRGATPRRAFVYGLLMGSVTNFGGFWWISIVVHDFGHLPAALAWSITGLNAVYQGLQFGIFASLFALVARGGSGADLWKAAALFTAVEFCFPLIFPWYMGNSQYRFLPAVQIADVLGVAGVTFTVVLANALSLQLVTTRSLGRSGAAALGWIVLVLAYGGARLWMIDGAIADAPKLRVGMVEANVGIFEKEAKGQSGDERRQTLHGNLLKHQRMSRELVEEGVELLVWPESSYIPDGQIHAKRLSSFAVGIGDSAHLRVWREQQDGQRRWSMGQGLSEGQKLRSIDACREDAVVLGGDNGSLLFWDGYSVRPIPIAGIRPGETPPDLRGVGIAGRGRPYLNADGAPVSIFAVGRDGGAFVGTPAGVSRVQSNTGETLNAVATVSEERGIAVGNDGVIVELSEEGGRPTQSGTDLD
ncbi:MAG: hypothetical protein VX938_03595, partial [Myxococcota bacterium]|nr:hypothetical protein [Myxococcota bacterium]